MLNLRENRITKIENLEKCTSLSQLNLAKNQLMNVAALEGLKELCCQPENELQSIDISCNYIDEEDPLVEFFDGATLPYCEEGAGVDSSSSASSETKENGAAEEEQQATSSSSSTRKASASQVKHFENINCIFMQSNPAVRRIKNYRRRLVAQLPNLTYSFSFLFQLRCSLFYC